MINDNKSMAHLAPEAQAEQALKHVLKQIRDRPEVGWYLGFGTETFALATEAYAALTQRDVFAVRQIFAPRNPRNPRAESDDCES